MRNFYAAFMFALRGKILIVPEVSIQKAYWASNFGDLIGYAMTLRNEGDTVVSEFK